MRVSECVRCENFPCTDMNHNCYIIPPVDVKPERVSILMVSEAAPPNPADYYYAEGNPLFQQTTVQAFKDAGVDVSTIGEVMELGVYLTTAVKCGKTAYNIESSPVKECSKLLERELALFPHTKAYLLMGDVAINALNQIARRNNEPRVIPSGSTYKIRGQAYFFGGTRVFPSYLQAGPSFFIEKSKRRMIAEDIAKALAIAK